MGQRPRRRTDAAVINAWCVYSALVPNRHLWTLDVRGRPATFATAGEASWKDAVRLAIEEAGCEPASPDMQVRSGTSTTSSNRHWTRWKGSSAGASGEADLSPQTIG